MANFSFINLYLLGPQELVKDKNSNMTTEWLKIGDNTVFP